MDRINKVFACEVKQVGDEKDRVLRFVGSDETIDRDDDIIEVAGWKLDDYQKNPVFLWAHSYDIPPIGKAVKVDKDMAGRKLYFDVKFPTLEELSSDIQNPSEHAKFVDTIYNLYKGGYLSATSVGFRGVRFKARDDDESNTKPEWQRGRRYMEQNLLELSAVPVPSNPSALVEARSKGLISDDEMKQFNDVTVKTPDTEGNPSSYDIEREIQNTINPNYSLPGIWVVDLYPTGYPSGKAVICRQNKYYLHTYAYEKADDTVKITLDAGVEVQVTYSEKALQERMYSKSGATISAKNREILNTVHASMDDCTMKLKTFLDSTMPMDPDDMPMMTAQMTMPMMYPMMEPMMSAMRTAIVSEIKEALDALTAQVLSLTPKSPGSSEDINLDDIQYVPPAKAAADIELTIEPDALKSLVTQLFKEQIDKLGGGIQQ